MNVSGQRRERPLSDYLKPYLSGVDSMELQALVMQLGTQEPEVRSLGKVTTPWKREVGDGLGK
jgi:hypothetical protein